MSGGGSTIWSGRLGRLVGVRRLLRVTVLGCVLALVAVLLPDSAPRAEQVSLVKMERSASVDVDPAVVWILAVGSDARPGENMSRTRADALQLIGMNTRTGAASAIGIPRDSWVPIPGHGSSRVNAALTYGGPELLGRTVGDLVGVQPDYVFVTKFPFFQRMVNAIGGIDVVNPAAFKDPILKPGGFRAGRIHLGGYQAMAYARIRKELPTGDFGRSAHQQVVLRGIHRKIRANADRAGFLENGVLSAIQHLRTDLPPAELFRLAQAVAQVEPAKVRTCVLPGSIGNVGGASVVLPSVATARRYGDDARRDATIERC
ncbi:LCP family protein [Nocardioides pantholopis]|uniref:LCP family protein n=1 Tax=Nocardioides pantholopis TaxID=2483798 RepID=UPI000F092E5D|nr:LCP family protein [Nocardioides pantholopis]